MSRTQAHAWLWAGSLLVFLVSLVHLSPLYLLAVNSFKTREELYNNVLSLPSSFSFQYYRTAMERMNIVTAFMNSLIITLVSTALIILFSSMTAWVLARNENHFWAKFIYMVFVATMLIPFQTLMMPLTQLFSDIQEWTGIPIIDTRQGLIFMAGYIDGASKWTVFWRIVFPMLRPITNTVMILNIIWIWNDYLLPSLVLVSDSVKTIPLSTFSFFGQFTIQWNLAMAGLVMTILPVIVFYAFAQRNIIRGIADGAVK